MICNRGPFLTRAEQYSFSDIVLGQIYNQEDLGHEHLVSFVHTKETVRELAYIRVEFHQIGEFIVKHTLLCQLPLKGIAVPKREGQGQKLYALYGMGECRSQGEAKTPGSIESRPRKAPGRALKKVYRLLSVFTDRLDLFSLADSM